MNPHKPGFKHFGVATLFSTVTLLAGCSGFFQSSYLSDRERDIQKAANGIAAAKTDAQRVTGYLDRADAYADKARFARITKQIEMEEYKRAFDLALADYKQALALDPENADAYYRRGYAYYMRAGLDMIYDTKATTFLMPAKADFVKAAEKNPKSAKTFDMLGLTDASLQDWTAAIADFEKEAALDPHSLDRLSDAYCNRGDAYMNEGKYDLAAADLYRAVELPGHRDPCECDPYNSLLTLFLIKTHEPDKAEAIMAKAVKSGRAIAPEYLQQLKKLKSGR